jgi:hypothetical protein
MVVADAALMHLNSFNPENGAAVLVVVGCVFKSAFGLLALYFSKVTLAHHEKSRNARWGQTAEASSVGVSMAGAHHHHNAQNSALTHL